MRQRGESISKNLEKMGKSLMLWTPQGFLMRTVYKGLRSPTAEPRTFPRLHGPLVLAAGEAGSARVELRDSGFYFSPCEASSFVACFGCSGV